jgi:hypothetical protein
MKKADILYWLVIILLLIGCVFTFMSKSGHIETKQDTQYVIDSLNGEISTLQIDNGRYEIIMGRLWEADSNFVDSALKNIE